MSFEERDEAMEEVRTNKNILFGTQSIFSEGISLNELSCLVLGTPVNNEPLLTDAAGFYSFSSDGLDPPNEDP